MDKYYINQSMWSGDYLVKKTEDGPEGGKIVQIFRTRAKAEEYVKKLNSAENAPIQYEPKTNV